MTLPVFVVSSEALRGEQVLIEGDEARHAAVRRIRVGERVLLTDGLGAGAECEVVSVAKAALSCAVRVRREAPTAVPRLTVVQAIPKGDHADRAVDLLTEVGVDVIVPWAASRNVVQWRGERAAKGVARWQAVATAAAKQSRRLRFPVVRDVMATDDVTGLLSAAGLALVLHESAAESLPAGLSRLGWSIVSGAPVDDVLVVVGPEGGISDEELAAFERAGASVVGVGPTVLRSSSAGIVAAALVFAHTRRWA